MSIRAAVGQSQLSLSFDAGKQAALAARDGLDGAKPGLAIVFGTSEYDQEDLLNGVREVVGDIALSGCSGEGIIVRSQSLECDYAVGVMLLSSTSLAFETFLLEDYGRDPAACGAELARLVGTKSDAVGLLLFPDGLVGNCTRFLAELESNLNVPVLVSGGASADAMAFKQTFQYGDGSVVSQGLAAVLIRGDGRLELAVSHGCSPIGLERTVTREKDGWVHEIDDQRAWSVFKEYLDGDPEDLNADGIVHLCIGKPATPTESQEYGPYVIHTPLALDKDSGALFFPSGGLSTGDKIRMTRRDPQRIKASARACADRILEQGSGQSPALVFQFDCAGRGSVLFGACAAEEIVQPLQEALGQTTPWLGFHTYGEIAPIGGKLHYHNYTVALCALYEGASAK
jgi:hypothetical protein